MNRRERNTNKNPEYSQHGTLHCLSRLFVGMHDLSISGCPGILEVSVS